MCNEENKVKCARCPSMEDPDHLVKVSNNEMICESCYEVDPTPTSEECDHCPETATTNFCGTNLCDDCAEQYKS